MKIANDVHLDCGIVATIMANIFQTNFRNIKTFNSSKLSETDIFYNDYRHRYYKYDKYGLIEIKLNNRNQLNKLDIDNKFVIISEKSFWKNKGIVKLTIYNNSNNKIN